MIVSKLFKWSLFTLLVGKSFLSIAQTPSDDSDSLDLILQKGTWVSGVEGGLSNSRLSSNSIDKFQKGLTYSFNFNSGVFLKENLAVGLNFRLSKDSRTHTDFFSNQEEVYFGPWVRYYMKFQHNWYVYPELGVSYAGFYNETVTTSSNELLITRGNGPGINPGVGIAYFVNKNASFSIRWNYQLNFIQAESESTDGVNVTTTTANDIRYGNASLLFGFQLYLNEFFF